MIDIDGETLLAFITCFAIEFIIVGGFFLWLGFELGKVAQI